MKKKVLSLLLSTAMVASLAACGSAADTGSTDTQSSDTSAQSGDAAATETADASADAAAEGYSHIPRSSPPRCRSDTREDWTSPHRFSAP